MNLKRLAVYGRVSSEEQAENQYAAEQQLAYLHIFVTSAPSCINFGTPEKPEGVLPSWAGHLHYVVSG